MRPSREARTLAALALDADGGLGDALALVLGVAKDRNGRRRKADRPQEKDHAVVGQ